MENLLDFNFDINNLIASFIFGTIGFYIFLHGKRNSNFSFIMIGVALMVYPYFVSNHFLNWGIGFALCGLAYNER